MALLDKVSVIREDYRELLVFSERRLDPTLEEEALKGSIEKYGEDLIVNMTVSITHRVAPKPFIGEPQPDINHLVLAVGVLDDLDTLGMEVKFKSVG
jgi:hypothetical protein